LTILFQTFAYENPQRRLVYHTPRSFFSSVAFICGSITRVAFRHGINRTDMKKIAMSAGKFALVDDFDFEWLSQWKWSYDGKK